MESALNRNTEFATSADLSIRRCSAYLTHILLCEATTVLCTDHAIPKFVRSYDYSSSLTRICARYVPRLAGSLSKDCRYDSPPFSLLSCFTGKQRGVRH